jgi:cytochrome c biogenesis protein ResB
MDRVYPLNQITLNVLYEPGIYLAYLGVFFLMAGLFVSVTFSRRRKK